MTGGCACGQSNRPGNGFPDGIGDSHAFGPAHRLLRTMKGRQLRIEALQTGPHGSDGMYGSCRGQHHQGKRIFPHGIHQLFQPLQIHAAPVSYGSRGGNRSHGQLRGIEDFLQQLFIFPDSQLPGAASREIPLHKFFQRLENHAQFPLIFTGSPHIHLRPVSVMSQNVYRCGVKTGNRAENRPQLVENIFLTVIGQLCDMKKPNPPGRRIPCLPGRHRQDLRILQS